MYMEAREYIRAGPRRVLVARMLMSPRAFGSSRAVGESRLYPSTHMFDAPSVFAAANTSAYLRHRLPEVMFLHTTLHVEFDVHLCGRRSPHTTCVLASVGLEV